MPAPPIFLSGSNRDAPACRRCNPMVTEFSYSIWPSPVCHRASTPPASASWRPAGVVDPSRSAPDGTGDVYAENGTVMGGRGTTGGETSTRSGQPSSRCTPRPVENSECMNHAEYGAPPGIRSLDSQSPYSDSSRRGYERRGEQAFPCLTLYRRLSCARLNCWHPKTQSWPMTFESCAKCLANRRRF